MIAKAARRLANWLDAMEEAAYRRKLLSRFPVGSVVEGNGKCCTKIVAGGRFVIDDLTDAGDFGCHPEGGDPAGDRTWVCPKGIARVLVRP